MVEVKVHDVPGEDSSQRHVDEVKVGSNSPMMPPGGVEVAFGALAFLLLKYLYLNPELVTKSSILIEAPKAKARITAVRNVQNLRIA